ncbi:hypothetical protein Pla8534_61420 [Lignipirellula cremea]|uniref:Uncharacterized protein n=2 Tax=Lignipirellula cremea TaxID=2528010 RepID=A0A518E2F9_9BACT|nr:hypothetical protein Pla8534_61420 [Lignipirellula cremea]
MPSPTDFNPYQPPRTPVSAARTFRIHHGALRFLWLFGNPLALTLAFVNFLLPLLVMPLMPTIGTPGSWPVVLWVIGVCLGFLYACVGWMVAMAQFFYALNCMTNRDPSWQDPAAKYHLAAAVWAILCYVVFLTIVL